MEIPTILLTKLLVLESWEVLKNSFSSILFMLPVKSESDLQWTCHYNPCFVIFGTLLVQSKCSVAQMALTFNT